MALYPGRLGLPWMKGVNCSGGRRDSVLQHHQDHRLSDHKRFEMPIDYA